MRRMMWLVMAVLTACVGQTSQADSARGYASDMRGPVQPNAYGLGINKDEYGRPHRYYTQDCQPLSPIFQDRVKRDAYGHGVHMDPFGRPVHDGPGWNGGRSPSVRSFSGSRDGGWRQTLCAQRWGRRPVGAVSLRGHSLGGWWDQE